MKLDNAFSVAAPLDVVWSTLCDIPRITPCMPGAEIIEVVDEATYRAKVKVKIGPLGVTYRATVVIEALDDGERIATIRIEGDDIKGAGGVRATVVSRAHERDGVTHVRLSTDAQIAGIIAKLGGKLIEAAARGFVAEFAGNLGKIVSPRSDGRPT